MTGLFYAALHLVEAYFYAHQSSDEPEGYLNHRERSQAVLLRISDQVFTQYRFLESQSRSARYHGARFSENDVGVVRRYYYEPLRDFIEQQLT